MHNDIRYLTIDQSTSATKVLLLDAAGSVLGRASKEHRQYYPKPGWVEHDANEIWENTVAVCSELLSANPGAAGLVETISLSNQRETVVVFEKGTGRPMHPAIVWQCRRGEPVCAKLREEGHEKRVLAATGLKLDAYFSASKLTWLVRENEEVASALRAGSGLAGTIDAYLVYRLTGGSTHATDTTNASRTLLFDIHNMSWDKDLCRLFEVPTTALPEVRDPGAFYGETNLEGLLPRRIPVRGVMGDSQASLLAHQCLDPGMGKVTLGSGSSVLVNTGGQAPTTTEGLVAALAWSQQGNPTYAAEGIITYSASTVAWLKDRLELLENVAESESLAASLPDNGGVYLVPAFSGLGAPHWVPEARAAIVGLSAHSTRAHVARAALESIAYQIADVLDSVARSTGKAIQLLHADGGPTANRWLMQFLADVIGTVVRVNPAPDLSPMGAFYAGLLGTGKKLPPVSDSFDFRPSTDRAWVPQARLDWSRAVRQVIAGA